MEDILKKCTLCPRECGINRYEKPGFCLADDKIRVARADLHMWEEPPISGEKGSGTVFFSGCNLRCVFCQNYDISRENFGKEISVERLAEIFIELQEKGANNINLVTPTHFIDDIVKALNLSRKMGLKLPIVYNTSSYEKVESLKKLDGLVDIYLPDFKYMDSALSARYSNAENYSEVAKKAIAEMVRQVGVPQFDEKTDLMTKGVIVRHLVLPGQTADSKKIIKYLYDTYGDDIFISIMRQYTPFGKLEDYPEINRKITDEEYDEVVDFAVDIGVENGFLQDEEAASESFIPKFNLKGV